MSHARASARTRRCARAAALRALRDACPTRRVARRLHDRCHPLHCRSHAAHRSDSARDAPPDRRLGVGMRSLPGRVPADEPRGNARRRARVHAARRRRRRARSLIALLRVAQRRIQTALSPNRRWAGAGRPCCGATRRSRSATRSTAPRSGARASAARAIRTRWCAGHAAWALGRIGAPGALAALTATTRRREGSRRASKRSVPP